MDSPIFVWGDTFRAQRLSSKIPSTKNQNFKVFTQFADTAKFGNASEQEAATKGG